MEKKIEHYECVDLLRGLSSVAVLIWHYNHFYHGPFGGTFAGIERSIQPLYGLLWPIYHHGLYAVQLFWLISGFVFAHVYAGSTISAPEFVLRRFARLYPLHFITLMVITAFQGLSVLSMGTTQIVGAFDLYHFVCSLFLYTPQWGFDFSFNVPVWSITIEEWIYGGFFLVCPFIFSRGLAIPLVLAGVSLLAAMKAPQLALFGLCSFFFFAGCVVYYVLQRAPKSLLLAAIMALIPIAWWGIRRIPTATGEAGFVWPIFLFLPLIMAVAAFDQYATWAPRLKRWRWFGDCTYSMYLWHFPLQVGVVLALNYFTVSRDWLNSPLSLAAWIAIMLVVGKWSFSKVERPLQNWIRRPWRQPAQAVMA